MQGLVKVKVCQAFDEAAKLREELRVSSVVVIRRRQEGFQVWAKVPKKIKVEETKS